MCLTYFFIKSITNFPNILLGFASSTCWSTLNLLFVCLFCHHFVSNERICNHLMETEQRNVNVRGQENEKLIWSKEEKLKKWNEPNLHRSLVKIPKIVLNRWRFSIASWTECKKYHVKWETRSDLLMRKNKWKSSANNNILIFLRKSP